MLCVRAGIARVSEDFVGFGSFVFHYWWDGLFLPAAIVRFAVVFRRICANRGWVDSLADTVMGNQIISSLNRTNAFLQYGSTQPIW